MPDPAFNVEVEALLDTINRKFDGMLKMLEETPKEISTQMQAWQTDDLHRRWPETDEAQNGNEFTAEMVMHPHSKPRPHHHTGNPRGRPRAGSAQDRVGNTGLVRQSARHTRYLAAQDQELLRESMWQGLLTRIQINVLDLIRWDSIK